MSIGLGLLEVGSRLIEKLIPDPAAKAQAQLDLLKLQQDGQFKELEARMSAIVTEASSPDPYTSRARPSFMYVFYILLLSSIPMGLMYAFNPDVAARIIEGFKLWLSSIPSELYELFGYGYVGYALVRTAEKIRGAK